MGTKPFSDTALEPIAQNGDADFATDNNAKALSGMGAGQDQHSDKSTPTRETLFIDSLKLALMADSTLLAKAGGAH